MPMPDDNFQEVDFTEPEFMFDNNNDNADSVLNEEPKSQPFFEALKDFFTEDEEDPEIEEDEDMEFEAPEKEKPNTNKEEATHDQPVNFDKYLDPIDDDKEKEQQPEIPPTEASSGKTPNNIMKEEQNFDKYLDKVEDDEKEELNNASKQSNNKAQKLKDTDKIDEVNPDKKGLWNKIKNVFRKIRDVIKDAVKGISEPGLLYARLAGGKMLANKIYDANESEKALKAAKEKENMLTTNKALNKEIEDLKKQLSDKDKDKTNPGSSEKQQHRTYEPPQIDKKEVKPQHTIMGIINGQSIFNYNHLDTDNEKALEVLSASKKEIEEKLEDLNKACQALGHENSPSKEEIQNKKEEINSIIDKCEQDLSNLTFNESEEITELGNSIDNELTQIEVNFLLAQTFFDEIEKNELSEETEEKGIREKMEEFDSKAGRGIYDVLNDELTNFGQTEYKDEDPTTGIDTKDNGFNLDM